MILLHEKLISLIQQKTNEIRRIFGSEYISFNLLNFCSSLAVSSAFLVFVLICAFLGS